MYEHIGMKLFSWYLLIFPNVEEAFYSQKGGENMEVQDFIRYAVFIKQLPHFLPHCLLGKSKITVIHL